MDMATADLAHFFSEGRGGEGTGQAHSGITSLFTPPRYDLLAMVTRSVSYEVLASPGQCIWGGDCSGSGGGGGGVSNEP